MTPDLFSYTPAAAAEAPRLLHKLRVVRESTPEYGNCRVLNRIPSSSRDIYEMFKPYCSSLDREEFQVLALDSKNKISGWNTVSVGTLNSAIVHPRDVFKFALLANAAGIIFVHNHPSGNPTPSDEDLLLTSRLVAAGKLLGIPVMDHVICGYAEWYSFSDTGRLK